MLCGGHPAALLAAATRGGALRRLPCGGARGGHPRRCSAASSLRRPPAVMLDGGLARYFPWRSKDKVGLLEVACGGAVVGSGHGGLWRADAAVFFGDLEPSLQALLVQVRVGGGEVEAVVGCSSLAERAPSATTTVVVGDSNSADSGNSAVGANCRGGAVEGLQPEGSVAEVDDVAERAVASGLRGGFCFEKRRLKTLNGFSLFREFVKMMSGKNPVTFLTDQCRAMEVAIANVLPGTKHRWCKWHALRKAKERLGALCGKNSQFKADFHQIVDQMLTKDEFEGAWVDMLRTYALEKNPYLYQIYEMREKWVKPYFSGVFCARMTNTQRSESTNHRLKTYVPPGSAMHVLNN
ncbi:hypothetical protein ACQ4PT_067404 [Festuca glaucescens]